MGIMEAALGAQEESFEEANRRLQALGLADGLPVVPPTMRGVRAFYRAAGADPARVLGELEPAMTPVSVYDVAINAVMAGCEPAHLPVLVAAATAATDPRLNLLGIQTTTGSATVALLVNGPIAARLGISGGADCLSGSQPANARIGRAFRLLLMNLGGARTGGLDMATMGQPAKLGLCFAENETASPWAPLHVERGLRPEQSTVTLLGISGTVEVVAGGNGSADEILQTLARSMTIAGNIGGLALIGGGEPAVLLAPEHARSLQAEGFDKAAVRRELWRRARLRLRDLAAATRERIEAARREAGDLDPDAPLAVAARSADIMLVVAGGIGVKSTFLPGWPGGTRSVTGVICDP